MSGANIETLSDGLGSTIRLDIHLPGGGNGKAWPLAGARWAWAADDQDGHPVGQGVASTAGDAVHDCLDVMVAWRDRQPW